MNKQEFTELVYKNIATWASTDHDEQANNLIGYCYDVLDDSEELSSVSEALAATKQELIEVLEKKIELEKQVKELDEYKNFWLKSINEIGIYKNLCKAQSDLINLK